MNHRTLTAAAVLAALTLAAGCSSSSTNVATDSSASTTTVTSPASVDRTSAAAVAAAFAADYASGDTPAACALTTGSATKKMTDQGMCQTRMSWNEVSRQIVDCPAVGNTKRYAYEVDREIARFLIFSIRLEAAGGAWSVAALGMSTPGDGDYGCQPLGANNGNG